MCSRFRHACFGVGAIAATLWAGCGSEFSSAPASAGAGGVDASTEAGQGGGAGNAGDASVAGSGGTAGTGGAAGKGGTGGAAGTGGEAGAGGQAGGGGSAGAAGAGGAVVSYPELTDPTQWTFFNLHKLSVEAEGYAGAAFDGRWLYFAPHAKSSGGPSAIVARFDTTAAFDSETSWETFDLTSFPAGLSAYKFTGAAFDGHYIYFVPNANGTIARYDPKAGPLGDATAWKTFDLETINLDANQFAGAAFDGKYLYLVPGHGYYAPSNSIIVRYDTTLAFDAAQSYVLFDLKANVGVYGFQGAIWDGKALYLMPLDGAITRFIGGSFTDPNQWEHTNLMQPTIGGAYDGTYIYSVCGQDEVGGVYHNAYRLDPLGTFTAASAYTAFDPLVGFGNSVGSVWAGAAFDGKYIYHAPFGNLASANGGEVLRVDKDGDYANASAWSHFNASALPGAGLQYFGAAFDGEYIYFVPGPGYNSNPANSIAARFHARTPKGPLPKGYSGSFL